MVTSIGKFVLLSSLAVAAFAAEANLRAGASRVDITPAPAELPAPYKTVLDRIYVRTILLDNGGTRAVMVVVDVPAIQAGIYNDLVAQVARDAGCPPENVVLAATHTHNSIRVDTSNQGAIITGSPVFVAKVKTAIGQSVGEAKAALVPARAGFGRGRAHIAVNRNQWVEKEQRYIVGADRTGKEPFDPAAGVLKFEDMAGEPIAFVINYGIEPVVVNDSKSEISGDVPGAVSRYVEDRYGGKVVAAFTIGAAGNPAYSARGGQPAHRLLDAMGTLLGEEVLAVSREIRTSPQRVPIRTAKRTVICPGKITAPLNLPTTCAYTPDSKLPPCRDYRDQDIDPVTLRLGLLKIGDVALVHADANLVPKLGLRLMEESPLSRTVFASLNFGPARFIVDDSSYPLYTYEATATRLKKGCGETGFINGVLEMMDEVNRDR